MKISQRSFKQLFGFIGIVCTVTLLSSCFSNPQKEIVGKWKILDTPGTIEFFTDGTYIL